MIKKSKILNFISALIGFCLAFTIMGSESQAKTAEQAMDRIVEALYKQLKGQELQRRVAFSVADWPSDSVQFVRVAKDNIPILGEPSLTASTLNIIGLTKSGEILQFIGKKEIIELTNPLGWEGVSSGIWYKVRLLDAREGWIFAKPENQTLPLATYFKKMKIKPKLQKQRDGVFSSLIGTLIGIVAVIAIILFIKSLTKKETSPGYYSDSSTYGDSEWDTHSEAEVNPIFKTSKIDKAILSDDKILKESSGKKVGRLEKAILSDDQIIRDSSGKKAGRIEQSIWDKDKQIIKSSNGKKEGEIKNDFWGNRIIVDSDGKEVGKIEKNIWGETVIKKK